MTVPGPSSSNLLAMIAHEFRTPLAAMQVTLEMLAAPDALPYEEVEQLVRRCQRSVDWLDGLVTNLETWAAIEDGRLKLDWAPVSILECAKLATSLVQPIMNRRRQGVRLICPPASPFVRGDSRLLCQVMVNLLTNASHYSQPDDEIDLAILWQSGWVVIRVTDNGPGVPLHEQVQIFDRYARGSQSVLRTEGSGLGLHIVKTLVELHRGTVGVDSIPTHGASFWFRLLQYSPPADGQEASFSNHHEDV